MSENYSKKGYLLENFRLFHLRDVQGAKVDYHYHEFYKLLFILSGSGGYSIEGKRYQLQAGDIVLVGNNCVHRPEFESGLPYERVILYISPEFLKSQSTIDCDLTECFWGIYGHVLRPDAASQTYYSTQITALEDALKDHRYGKEIISNSILLQILVEISRAFRQDQVQKPAPILPKNKRVLEIIKYLDAHLTEDINIDVLTEKFYCSRFHMMRQFKEETGTSIHTYLSDKRLLLARDLIAHGMPATESCFHCGFQSYASFARAYGKLFGCTPTGRKISGHAVEGTFE